MPEVYDWQTVPDPHAVLRRAVEVLRAGRLAALPTETGGALAASGLCPGAVAALCAAARPGEVPALAVRGVDAARDWAPDLAPLARRLGRRLWPGPLELQCGGAGGLAGRLPEGVRAALCPDGRVRLRAPAHEATLEVLRQLPGPLVLAEPGEQAGAAVEWVLDDGPGQYRGPATVVEVEGGAWQVVRPGVLSDEQVRRGSACLVVFVCTGNTCRSPLAEALLKKRLADRLGCAPEELSARGFCVLSAGLAAMMGGGAAPEAVEVARGYGADLARHASQPLTPELAAGADHLVAMTRGHLRALQEHYPRLGCRPRLLDPAGEDVADPIGCEQAVYEACARDIWRHLEAIIAELCP